MWIDSVGILSCNSVAPSIIKNNPKNAVPLILPVIDAISNCVFYLFFISTKKIPPLEAQFNFISILL
jgi:hypothetical protein